MLPRTHAKIPSGKVDFIQLLKKSLNESKKSTKPRSSKITVNKKKTTARRQATLH